MSYFTLLSTRPGSLATETEYVRATLAAYANDMISLGVDGLRLDAAKRNIFSPRACADKANSVAADINVSDIANITSRLTTSPYITQEVIYGAGQPITPNQYVVIGTLVSSKL